MSINDVQQHNSIINRRRSNSLDKNKYNYYFPNNQSQNQTNEYGEKDFYKPRIIKNKKIINNDINYNYENNLENNKKTNNPNRVYSTHDIKNNVNNNFIPRIVRHKKNYNKFINKNNNLRENEKIDNNNNYPNNNIPFYNNKYKKAKSIDKNSINLEDKKNNNLYNDNYSHISNKSNNNNINNLRKINRNSSFDNKSNTSENITNLLCKNCFDKKMLEQEGPNKEIDKIEYLNDKFINENPFYFIDKMSENEKNRINQKIESNSNKQKLALDNYKKEIDNPKNNNKEKLQLINEYSLNPLSIEVGKDPRYLKQKKNYDKKEKIIHQNPDKYRGLEPRKAYDDYYNKCIYQIPKFEQTYHINPMYKENYIRALKKQIEDKKNKENEDKKKQRMAEAFANKQFNDYKKRCNLNDKEKLNNDIEFLKNENKKLDDFKKHQNNLLKEKEKKLEDELEKKNNKMDKDIKLRNKNEKFDNIETYQDWLDDIDKKKQNKKDNEDEEKKKWNDYIKNYNLKCNGEFANCDLCNKPSRKERMKKFPPPPESVKTNFEFK